MIMERLLQTAVEQFGLQGFEGASTRDIAKASGTAMSSITYHFGGKEGLYLAAADYIAACIKERQAPGLDAARRAIGGSREQAAEAVAMLIDGFAQMMLASVSEAWSQFIVREQQYPTAAFERLYGGAICAMVETLLALIATARPDLADREARALAITLVGQAMILRVGRASLCRLLETETVTAQDAELLRSRLRANVLAILLETRS